MQHESDGVADAMHSALRVSLTAAGMLAERRARDREQQMRTAQAHSEQEAREVQARLDAERTSATASLAPVHESEWWDAAETQDIADMWETAHTLRSEELQALEGMTVQERLAVNAQAQPTEAGLAEDRIRDELRERHGIDVDELDPLDGAALQDALSERHRAHQQAERDQTGAHALLNTADVADRDQQLADGVYPDAHPDAGENLTDDLGVLAEGAATPADRDAPALDHVDNSQVDQQPDVHVEAPAEATVLYDSATARQDAAAGLEGVVDQETIEARLVADTAQAQPAQRTSAGDAQRSANQPTRPNTRTRPSTLDLGR